MVSPYIGQDEAVERLKRGATKMQLSRDGETLVMREADSKAVANIEWPDLTPHIDTYDIQIADGVSVRYQQRHDGKPTLEILVSKEKLKESGLEYDGDRDSIAVASTNGSSLYAAYVLGKNQSVHFTRHGPGEHAFIVNGNLSTDCPSVHIIHGKENIAYLANLGVNFPGSEKLLSGKGATA